MFSGEGGAGNLRGNPVNHVFLQVQRTKNKNDMFESNNFTQNSPFSVTGNSDVCLCPALIAVFTTVTRLVPFRRTG